MQNFKSKMIVAAATFMIGTAGAFAAVTQDGGAGRGRAATGAVAQGGSCSAWKSTCESRGGGASCESKYRACLKSGCFTEGAKFGGATHCSLAKQ
jgi:hypothetical protein